ncbi:MAG: aldo/keto reductase [Phycisphaerales bacterium]|nr:aldo/keto reductase [Phycisphaerales bacterium]
MRMRPLGESGIEASTVAIGTWVMGGWMWGGADESDSINAVHAAIDEGINLLDTAPIYGFGHSESVVGKAIKDRRDKVVLATKCGMVINAPGGRSVGRSDAGGPSEHGHLEIKIWNNPDSIRQEVELSLKRLQTDYIDLYQTHWQEEETPIEDTMGTLVKLKEEGKIRAIGVCNATPEIMDRYRSVGQLDSDQEQYSMIHRKMEGDAESPDQLGYCLKKNTAVLAYSPLVLGLLTGKVGPEREFPESDLRSRQKRFSKANRQKVADLLAEFEPISAKHGCSMAQLVIAWTTHQPGLTHALVGARTAKQAKENAAAGRVELDSADLDTMNALVRSDATELDMS